MMVLARGGCRLGSDLEISSLDEKFSNATRLGHIDLDQITSFSLS